MKSLKKFKTHFRRTKEKAQPHKDSARFQSVPKRIFLYSASALFPVIIGGIFYFGVYKNGLLASVLRGSEFEIVAKKIEDAVRFEPHPLSGKRCETHRARPFAVMMPEDAIARPLSGITQADVVVEMPVVQGSITRMMAIFACNHPNEIGSVRSSRHDFIPLAAGFDAIYAHWGGSHFALDLLRQRVIDNIDALTNPYDAYIRKYTLSAPHNGFTSWDRLSHAADELGYRKETRFVGYPYTEDQPHRENPNTVSIAYLPPYNVNYIYDPEKNTYFRWRGGTPEIDALTKEQVMPKVLVIMKTKTRPLEGQYNDVDVTGEGEVLIFQNGMLQRGKWKKADQPVSSKLYFLNEAGNEIPLVAGTMWLHIIDKSIPVRWGEQKL